MTDNFIADAVALNLRRIADNLSTSNDLTKALDDLIHLLPQIKDILQDKVLCPSPDEQ